MSRPARRRSPTRDGLALLLTAPLLGACVTDDVEAGGVAGSPTPWTPVAGDAPVEMSAMPSPAAYAGAGYPADGLPSDHGPGISPNPADGR